MWSEHCSYKSSRRHLRKLPIERRRAWSAVRARTPARSTSATAGSRCSRSKATTIRHSSSRIRAPRPASAEFCATSSRWERGRSPAWIRSSSARSTIRARRYLLGGVVGGIGGYGNCVGVPTVGGEVMFDAAYNGNILVNAFCLGLARTDELQSARARGAGNPVLYVGSATGRDGIHGASLLASAEFDATSEAKRPTVQVGDPFTEKLLIEACLEAMQTGAIVAIQDMGAAGLTSSSSEMAARGGARDRPRPRPHTAARSGADAVRDAALGVAGADAARRRARARSANCRRCSRNGICTRWWSAKSPTDERWRVEWRGKVVADIPVAALTDEAPVYDRPVAPPPLRRRKPASEGSGSSRRRRRPCAGCSKSQRRLQAMGLSPVRFDGAEQHGDRARQRCRGAADQGIAARLWR